MQLATLAPIRTAPSKPVQETYTAALPATGFVRLPIVTSVCGLAKSTVWKWCADGRFPKPVKLSPRVSAWPVAQVRAWLADPAAWQASNGREA
jgi:predicted DNA-binding transcriptional regulator AlpA